MASGPEHFREAEKLIAAARTIGADDLSPAQLLMATLAEAQTRATLALAAATALRHEYPDYTSSENSGWAQAAS